MSGNVRVFYGSCHLLVGAVFFLSGSTCLATMSMRDFAKVQVCLNAGCGGNACLGKFACCQRDSMERRFFEAVIKASGRLKYT